MSKKLEPCPLNISMYEKMCMFRAKRLRDGEEVYGNLVIDGCCTTPFAPVSHYHIVQMGCWNGEPINVDDLVDPDTVEIWMGKLNEYGRAIYEPFPAVLARRAATEANEALTLAELREMDGEPVYISGLDVWVLVNTDSGVPVFVFRDGGVVSSSDCYEVDYFAYRRPPEGGME